MEERAKETRKVLCSSEGAGLSVKEERRELWGRAVPVQTWCFAKHVLAVCG